MHNLLDTHYHVETPEAIDLTAQVAGPVPRILAFLIDLLIRSIALAVLFTVLAFAEHAGLGLFAIIYFVLEWFYPVLFEVLRNGQTPGKKYLQIAVVNDDLTPVTWSTSIIRNLLRAADFLPFGYALGLTVSCTSHNFQRLGDLAAGSIVIHKRKPDTKLNDLPDTAATPPPVALSLQDQVAITGFIQRHSQLSPARQQELADILADITGKQGVEGVKAVQGMGNWLLGNR